MQTLLILVELFVSIALVVVILLQRSEGGALGMGGGGSGLGGLFSPRGAADTLTRTTGILAVLFFLTCLGLNLIGLRGRDERSILESSPTSSIIQPVKTPAPAAPKPSQAPAVPAPH
ncbi:MAG: preprotein translocase subunit SecG [Alphaproteobacteria bacterium]|nr:preprotein translocase subunit SecG [Alphaproteobacteria bacterium]